MSFDIFFLSYSESNADENWRHLAARFPQAKRVHGVKGVKNAHQVVARESSTDFFFLVDGDNRITAEFDFTIDFEPQKNTLYVWRALNAVNGLVYGFGALKLYNRDILARNSQTPVIDVATTVAPQYKIINIVASTTHFNASPLEAWRGAFRECAKLQLNCFKNPKDLQSLERLNHWIGKTSEAPFAADCLAGARQGRDFTRANWQNSEALAQINDFDFLNSLYDSFTKERLLFTFQET